MKALLLLLPFLLFASEQEIENKLHYKEIDPNNKALSQKQISTTYLYGIGLMKDAIVSLKTKNNLDRVAVEEECNESLYVAIFGETIVDKLGRESSKKQFMRDCKNFIKTLK